MYEPCSHGHCLVYNICLPTVVYCLPYFLPRVPHSSPALFARGDVWNFVFPISYRAHARPPTPRPPSSLHPDRFHSFVLILSFEYISSRVRSRSARVCTVQTRILSLPCALSRPLDSPRALRRLVTAVFLTCVDPTTHNELKVVECLFRIYMSVVVTRKNKNSHNARCGGSRVLAHTPSQVSCSPARS